MIAYRLLAHNFQKRSGITFDESLSSISVILRAVAGQLSRDEVSVLKANVPPELKQLLAAPRVPAKLREDPHGQGHPIVEQVSLSLEITDVEAKRRVTALLVELKSGVSPWDDSTFLELLDHVYAAVDRVPVQAAVA